jgi:hypothetical protein
VKITIPYGDIVLPRGTRLRVISRDAQTLKVEYMGRTYSIPVTSTDFENYKAP